MNLNKIKNENIIMVGLKKFENDEYEKIMKIIQDLLEKLKINLQTLCKNDSNTCNDPNSDEIFYR